MLEGVLRTWYPGGGIMEERLYKAGRPDGLTRYYNDLGRLTGETVFAAGEPAEAREFFENSRLRILESYTDGELVNRKTFDRTGRAESEEVFEPEHENQE